MPYSFQQVKNILSNVQSRAKSNPESVVDYIDGDSFSYTGFRTR